MTLAILNIILNVIFAIYISVVYISRKEKILYLNLDIERLKEKELFYNTYLISNIAVVMINITLSVFLINNMVSYQIIMLSPMLLQFVNVVLGYAFRKKYIVKSY
ncbi:MAG: hypothetical protein ACRDCB_11645 [Clostridium sp.]|uniref:hypothetical protein n=1 Tax=Clostridium chrysemydis TaxID=2665504 RepID=UPI003EE72B51